MNTGGATPRRLCLVLVSSWSRLVSSRLVSSRLVSSRLVSSRPVTRGRVRAQYALAGLLRPGPWGCDKSGVGNARPQRRVCRRGIENGAGAVAPQGQNLGGATASRHVLEVTVRTAAAR